MVGKLRTRNQGAPALRDRLGARPERPDAESGAEARRGLGDGVVVTRIDTHCHSHASDKPVMKAAGVIGCPECYSEPERVYDQARARGMDLVTITDHDTIRGALELHQRGFQGFIIGQEVSVRFPEDRCMLHVLVWGLTPEQDEQLNVLGLRDDIYSFAAWLREHNLAHACAHPLYIQNGKLTRWHVERAALLFKCFETRNGAHADELNDAIARWVAQLSAGRVHQLVGRHGIEPLWPRVWEKGCTGGSDDHALLNTGRTWTELRAAAKVAEPATFLRALMNARVEPGGNGGHSALLAHQISTVGANHYARTLHERRSPVGKYVGAKILRFFGIDAERPSKKRVAAYKAARRVWSPKGRKKSLPIIRALKHELGPILDQYPDLRARLDPGAWPDGAAVSEHERMADLVTDVTYALSAFMEPKARKAFQNKDLGKIADHLVSYAALHAAQLPYIVSLFCQNKERVFVDRFEHEAHAPGSGVSVLERPMKVMLFSDTVADVNGVSRFIQNVATEALRTGRDLEVVTSTRFACPDQTNIRNFKPVFAMKMPKYDALELALPPLLAMLRHADKYRPDVIHVSTPGPVGCIGFLAAKMLRVPMLGVYHTDFPAYVDKLFDDVALTKVTEKFMSFFYGPFASVFTRSDDYVSSLRTIGLGGDHVVKLLPGFDNRQFHTRFRDPGIWAGLGAGLGAGADTVKVLYVGRVSVEKNLPLLTKIWKTVSARVGDRAELIVVGGGPYTEQMQRELRKHNARFLGFKHGDELSTIYASSDLFVFPSATDTLGQVVMESQGSGLAVLVSDQGGPKEVVQDGRSGFVLPAHEPGPWIDRIVELIEDDDRRRSMGAAGHAYMQGFSLSHSFDHYWNAHVDAWRAHLAARGISPDTAGAEPVSGSADAARPARNGSTIHASR